VDDDESVRHSLVRLCRSEGFLAESYHSAESFLDTKQTEVIDCLILDYRLPGKNGLELLHEVRAHHKHMPVLMVSGDADEEVRDRAIENGAIACLPKPVASGHLLDIVRWALKTRVAE
jgi:FixJ family two-component response regulator